MIGNYARGFRHLKRVVENSKTRKVFIIQNGRVLMSEMLVAQTKDNNEKCLICFQSLGGDSNINKFHNEQKPIVEKLIDKYGNFYVANNQHKKYFIADENFDDLYDSFRNNNKKLLDQVYGKYCYPHDAIANFIFALSGNTPNLYVWAVTNYYKNSITLNTIEHVIRFSQNYNKLVGKLSKGTITAYNGRDKANELISEIVSLRANKRANDAINLFNTAQKKLLKKLDLTDKTIQILNKFGRLSNVKKHNFVRKMSTIEDVDDILRQMSMLTNIHFEWNRNSLVDYIKNADNINCNILLDNNNIVLVEVKSYDTVKLLAKATNWCISKNKKYWNDYVEFRRDANQYIIFDFNQPEDHDLSIVGFTTIKGKGISNAHSYKNNNLMGAEHIDGTNQLVSFMDNINGGCNNIHSLIRKNNIPLSKILNFTKSYYEWNMPSFMSFLDYCIPYDEYDIHYLNEDEGRIVLSTNNDNVKFLIGNKQYKNSIQYIKNVFLFVDFNYEYDDPNRIKYGFIYSDEFKKEEYCERIYNCIGNVITDTFDELLEEYGLPYDTISRTHDLFSRFKTALRNYDLRTARKLIKVDEIRHTIIKNEKRNSTFKQSAYNTIYDSIFNMRSFDIVNLIYDSGMTIYDFVGTKNLDDLLTSLIYEVTNNYQLLRRLPNANDIAEFNNGAFQGRHRLYIGMFLIVNKILNNEDKKLFGKKLIDVCKGMRHNSEVDEYFMKYVIDKLSFTKPNHTSDFYVKHIARLNSKVLNEIMFNTKLSDDYGKLFVNNMQKSFHLYNEFKEKYGVSEEETSDTENNSTKFEFPQFWHSITYTTTNTTN